MIDQHKLKEFLELKDESPKVEFKLKYELTGQNKSKNLDELAKDLLALTNTAGRAADDFAYLIIGAGDTLKPDGTRDAFDVRSSNFTAEQFLNIVNARCTPPVAEFRYEVIDQGGNFYGVVEIPPSPYIHELTRNLDTPRGSWQLGGVLIRRGSQIGIAGRSEMKQMEREKENWSGVSADAKTALEQLEEFLHDPRKKIAVRRLVLEEAKALHAELNKPEFLAKDSTAQNPVLNERIAEYENLTRNLLDLFVAGCYHGGDELDSVWSDALTVVGDTTDEGHASDAFLRLRRFPAMLLFYAGGIAAIAGERYKTLAAMFHKTKVRRWRMQQSASEALPPATVVDRYDRKELSEYQFSAMPLEFHLRNYLRTSLAVVIHTEDEYLDCFTRFEYFFALDGLAKSNGIILGSYMWESEIRRKYQRTYSYNTPVIGETNAELEQDGAEWLPYKNGIFSMNWEKFLDFKKEADKKLSETAQNFMLTKNY